MRKLNFPSIPNNHNQALPILSNLRLVDVLNHANAFYDSLSRSRLVSSSQGFAAWHLAAHELAQSHAVPTGNQNSVRALQLGLAWWLSLASLVSPDLTEGWDENK